MFDLFNFICYNMHIYANNGEKVMFIWLSDLIGFDAAGELSATKICSIEQVCSNFLYIVSKYNQRLIKDEAKTSNVKPKLPEFFMTELKGLLQKVENKEISFEKAEKQVISNCLPSIQKTYKNAKSKRDILCKLCEQVTLSDEDFTNKNAKTLASNGGKNKFLQYIMTVVSGSLMTQVEKSICDGGLTDDKEKSKIFKGIISYNTLVQTAERLSLERDIVKNRVS